MAKKKSDDPKKTNPAGAASAAGSSGSGSSGGDSSGGGRDRLITALLGVAAAISVVTLGVLASRFSGSEPTEPDQLLRLASAQFVEGEIVVAGKLAEKIDLGEENPLPPDFILDPDAESAAAPASDPAGQIDDADQADPRNDPRVLQQFLIGMGKIAQANLASDSRKRRTLQTEGVEALDASRRQGFPPGRDSIGNQTLGITLARLGRYNEAIEPLANALAIDPTIRRTVLPHYANALRRGAPPRLDQAIAAIKQFLSASSLSTEDRSIGQGIELEILVDQKRFEDAEQKIAAIQAAGSDVTVSRGPAETALLQLSQLLMGKILVGRVETELRKSRAAAPPASRRGEIESGVDPKWLSDPKIANLIRSAITTLSEVVRTASPNGAIAARLVMGRLYRLIGDKDRALLQLSEARQQRPLQSIGTLAGLEEIELLAQTGDGESLTQAVRYLIREIEDPAGFDATELSLDEFRRRTSLAITRLHQFEEFENAILAFSALPPLFEPAESLIGQGRAYAAWAAATETVGRGITPDRQTAALARSRYRAAGAALAEAAEEMFGTAGYVDTQWEAIEAYQNGRHFRESIRLLEPYLRYVDRRQSSRGLLAMGRALLTEGRAEEAIEVLNTCLVEQTRDALRYDARLWIAKAHREMGQPELAKRFLLENLRDGSLTPDSPAWRDSLFALGDTMQAEVVRPLIATHTFDSETLPPGPKRTALRSDIEQTLRYIDEAIERYWPSPQAQAAVYASAMTDRAAAKLDEIESNENEMLDAARRALVNRSMSHLKSATDKMQRLADHLVSVEDERRLTPGESNLLRNAMMMRGDLFAQMQNHEDAIEAYRIVEQRHVHTPIALEAIMRRRESLRFLGRRDEANLLVRQAKATLERIGPSLENQFTRVSRYDRRGWEDYLGWLSGRLDQSS